MMHACRIDDKVCEGLGVMLCGTPMFKVEAGFNAKMVNKKNAANSQELRIQVSHICTAAACPPAKMRTKWAIAECPF